jgi:exopolysaccharide biosynthesis polyprenyl glycosylphosphotransferase
MKIKMDARQDKYNITKLLPADMDFDTLCQEIRKYDAVVLNDVPAQLRNDILKFCYLKRVRTYVAPKLTDIMVRGAENNSLFDTPLLLIKGTGLTPMQRIAKRSMDILLCSIAMLVAAPVMAVVAIAIKLEDGGPVFFKQDRVSLDGEVFKILKFRSMIVNAEKDGKSIPATGKDPRITKVGRFTRATRIDELPQLINVLKGDMSLVGPRPERIENVYEYSNAYPEFELRHKVKGGITGYAQLYGKYNTSPKDKLNMDLIYIETYSIVQDIKLLILTIKILFMKESTEGFDASANANIKAPTTINKTGENDGTK